MTLFSVTLLGDDDVELEWKVEATDPESGLEQAQRLSGWLPGIYSVWDPEDPMGMPLLEATRSK